MIEDELRDAFARHEAQAPALEPLRRAIDVLAGRRRRRRAVTRAGAAAVVAALAVALPVQVWRGKGADVLVPLIESVAPVAVPEGPLNLLLLGLDQRGTLADSRADTIMLVHLPADGGRAYLFSINRDVVVDIPGEGRERISATYYYSGAEGTRKAVEKLTGLRVDAVATVKFTALRSVTDALGKVPVCLPDPVTSDHTGTVFPRGCRDYSGRDVDDLIRQRKHLPHGGYDRDRIGQRVVLGLARKAGQLDILRDAGAVRRLAATPGVTVDVGGLDLLGLALRLDGTTPDMITGIGQPTWNSTPTGGERLDPKVAPELFAALREGTMEAFVSAHPDWVLQE
ncbi:LCP family protein [Catellatospora sp. NPDC049609]|uniref:LCP family protein n=1 Tax=Catellatospora sp. NPDC049609 TaxID=3155505 RepID=UPI0034248C79